MADPPRRRSRSRSRSPPRRPKGGGGFKWKEKRSGNLDDDDRDRRDRPLERGYRNRSPRRDRDRHQDRDMDKERPRDQDRDRSRDRNRDSGRDRDRDGDRNRDRAGGGDSSLHERDQGRGISASKPSKDRKDKNDKATGSAKAPKPAAGSGEEMIIVHVNDRLGTKAAIPCFASDLVRQFKVMVAMRIGREPHEILLKRQGERPFKDQLSLEDYGVSNGVQLDLEVDTGD